MLERHAALIRMIPAFFTLPSLFSVFLIMLLLLGETYVRWYLTGIFALFVLATQKNLDFSWVKKQSKTATLWLCFLGALGVSALFTHHAPLTLSTLSFYGFVFLVFVWSLSLKEEYLKKGQLSLLIVLVGAVLSALSLIFLFNQPLAISLPGMNLLYATFGHNHIAALLLLILPVAWREMLLARRQQERWLVFATSASTLLMTAALLVSFGRAALLLGITQLGVLWFLYQKHSQTKCVPFLKILFPALSALFAVLLGAKIFFSYQAAYDSQFVCPFPRWMEEKICKPFYSELRPLYAQQAWQAAQDFPIVGYGPGTFPLVNKKYQQLPYATTSYAHNHFLQMAAEGGLLTGGLFLWLIVFLYKQTYRAAFSASENSSEWLSLRQAFFVGSATVLANALVDFDWSYVGIFSLTLFFLGMVLRGQSEPPTDAWSIVPPVRRVSMIISVLLLIWSTLFLTTEILTRHGKAAIAFDVFPYFHEHLLVFETASEQLTNTQQQRLQRLYRFDSASRIFSTSEPPHDELGIALRSQVYALNPWGLLTNDDIAWHLESGRYQAADESLSALVGVLENAEHRFGYDIGLSKKFTIMEKRLDVADYFFTHGDPQKTARYYLWAQQIEPWIFSKRQPPITLQTPVADLEAFLQSANAADPKWWGEKYSTFVEWHFRVFDAAVERGDTEGMGYWYQVTTTQFPFTAVHAWNHGSRILSEQTQEALDLKNRDRTRALLSQWQLLKQLYETTSDEKNAEALRWEQDLQRLTAGAQPLLTQ